jgi:molybdenum transport protein
MEEIKSRACEKKVIVETECEEEALRLCKVGVGGIQFDKIQPVVLKEIVNMFGKFPKTNQT